MPENTRFRAVTSRRGEATWKGFPSLDDALQCLQGILEDTEQIALGVWDAFRESAMRPDGRRVMSGELAFELRDFGSDENREDDQD